MPGRHAAPPPVPRRALAELAHLVLPVACAGCGRPDVALCRACRDALAGRPGVVRGVAGVPVVAALAYRGPVRRLLLAWKDDGRHDLRPVVAGLLGRVLAPALAAAGPGAAVVPVPSSAAAVRRRGADVLAEVTRDAVRRCAGTGDAAGDGAASSAEVVAALRQRRRVADQAGLGVLQRRDNLTGALVVPEGPRGADLVRGRPVVLVDDVVTTGATVADGVRALRSAGAEVVTVVVIAVTHRRTPVTLA